MAEQTDSIANVLSDHGDARPIVELGPDHPGFRDQEYRARRNQIAAIALNYHLGEPLPEAPYTVEEHQVWQTIWQALRPAHQEYACAEYLTALKKLEFTPDQIPQLREVSEKVRAISGFRFVPAAGLVKPRKFFESLADSVFLCTQYIRHHSTPLYTPEPDVVHEIVGHGVTLACEQLAEINRLVGQAVKCAKSQEAVNQLSRVYWFTIEFGVLREKGELKAYGTGLLSSAGEMAQMHQAELRPLDLNAVAEVAYDPIHYQKVLFCAESFDEMYQTLKEYLVRWQQAS